MKTDVTARSSQQTAVTVTPLTRVSFARKAASDLVFAMSAVLTGDVTCWLLCQENHCVRVHLLGDCYFAVCGVPDSRPDHAKCCVELGVDVVDVIKYVLLSVTSTSHRHLLDALSLNTHTPI